MKQVDLITEALTLTIFGMGFVFLFLTLLVFITKFMSIIIRRINRQTPVTVDGMDDELNEETKFVIEEAIKIHRGA